MYRYYKVMNKAGLIYVKTNQRHCFLIKYINNRWSFEKHNNAYFKQEGDIVTEIPSLIYNSYLELNNFSE